jgi:hypothetical protein
MMKRRRSTRSDEAVRAWSRRLSSGCARTQHSVGIVFPGNFDGEWLQEVEAENEKDEEDDD